jgi:hypothetical protein
MIEMYYIRLSKIAYLSGNRYELCGADLPKLYEWANGVLGLDINKYNPARKDPIINPA